MKRLLLVVIPCLVLSACSAKNEQASTSSSDNTRPQAATNTATTDTVQADNSGANKVEKNYTAEQQSNDPKDIKITSEIRRAIMNKKGLSINAQNIKIIANGGQVTLRGPVDSPAEKSEIASIAKSCAGVSAVNDQLQLKSKDVATKNGKEVR